MAWKLDTDKKGFTFIWILENFEYCEQKTGQFLKSPTFIVDTIDRSKWSLWICPRGYESKEWISVFMGREKDSKGPAIIEVGYEIAFLASDGSVLTSKTVHKDAYMKPKTLGFSEFQKRDSVFAQRATFLPQDTLTIRCRIWRGTGEIEYGQCIARTRIGVERKVFLWKIQNFRSFNFRQEITFKLKSTSDDKPIVSFILFLRNNWGISKTICIKLAHSNQSILFSRFKCSIVDANGDYVDCGQHEFSPPTREQETVRKQDGIRQQNEFELSLSKDSLIDNSTLYLPNEILTLHCEYTFSSDILFNGIETTTYECISSFRTSYFPDYRKTATVEQSDSNAYSDLKMDIITMVQDNFLCDVKLCTESESFPAHWFILSARSPVFRAMLKRDMKKRAKGRIDILDLEPDTVRRMLLYMYTDSLGELKWKTAFDLYIAAKKFEIKTLKDKCSSFLNTNLSITNACKILFLADLHQDKELKSTTQDFILKNDKSIVNSSEWKVLMKHNLQLAAETILLKYNE